MLPNVKNGDITQGIVQKVVKVFHLWKLWSYVCQSTIFGNVKALLKWMHY
jgi:hypothetical protein